MVTVSYLQYDIGKSVSLSYYVRVMGWVSVWFFSVFGVQLQSLASRPKENMCKSQSQFDKDTTPTSKSLFTTDGGGLEGLYSRKA